MDKVLPTLPAESFTPPTPEDSSRLKPILRGELGSEPHSILYWVDKDNPRGPIPSYPGNDPQFNNWEYGVQRWVSLSSNPAPVVPTQTQIILPAPLPTPPGF